MARRLSIAMPEQRLRIDAGVTPVPYPEAADLMDAGRLTGSLGVAAARAFLPRRALSHTGAHPLALGVLEYHQERLAREAWGG